MKVSTITPSELFQIVSRGEEPEILDVRTPAEYDAVRILGTKNIPLDRLDVRQYLAHRQASAEKPIYVLCKGGTRARMACERFLEAGFPNAILIDGGIMAWEACNLPIERQVPNVESQVRLTIGTLNLIGVVLAAMVSPYFLILPAFVGCGLIYAGLTGKCPLAHVIASMPWNRVAAGAACCNPATNQ
ncbi:MAG: rhodanese-like domain-containing protein [Candidatus Sumerlaeaceae bacterium]